MSDHKHSLSENLPEALAILSQAAGAIITEFEITQGKITTHKILFTRPKAKKWINELENLLATRPHLAHSLSSPFASTDKTASCLIISAPSEQADGLAVEVIRIITDKIGGTITRLVNKERTFPTCVFYVAFPDSTNAPAIIQMAQDEIESGNQPVTTRLIEETLAT